MRVWSNENKSKQKEEPAPQDHHPLRMTIRFREQFVVAHDDEKEALHLQ